MLKNLLSQTRKFHNICKVTGCERMFNLPENSDFQSLLNIFQKINQESIESNISLKFDEIYKYGVNTFLPISNNENFTIGIFFLPKGKSIPLHDHPHMIVLSKALAGVLNYISIDYFNDEIQMELPKKLFNFKSADGFDEITHLASLNQKGILKTNDFLYLTPNSGNIHQFEAQENSAILDVLVPSYDLIDRYCNFYEIKDLNDRNVKMKYMFPPPDYDCILLDYPIKI